MDQGGIYISFFCLFLIVMRFGKGKIYHLVQRGEEEIKFPKMFSSNHLTFHQKGSITIGTLFIRREILGRKRMYQDITL